MNQKHLNPALNPPIHYQPSTPLAHPTTLPPSAKTQQSRPYYPCLPEEAFLLNRRQFLLHSALATPALRAALSQPPPTTRVVRIAQGQLRGEEEDGLQIFRGVPFARPPVGPLRFRPPHPPEPWTNIRDATAFAAASVQPGVASIPQSEDCLYLNLWAPTTPGPHPVFVWIHGGGFTGGNSFDPLFNGSRFARDGIVCITVAYRLGALGFLDVAPMLGPSYVGSADNALRDLIAALAWVQSNVDAFGGDPGRVTIGGESAGAKLAGMLMGIRAAETFFHQVVSESGGAERIWPEARAVEVSHGFATAWTAQTRLAPTQLVSASARQIVDVQQRFTRDWPVHFPLRAELDSALVPRNPLAAIHAGSTRGKRLLLGTNREESAAFIGPHPEKNPGAADLGNLTLAQFQPIAARYRRLYPEMSDEMIRIRSVTAEEYWVPSMRVAEAHVAGGGEAFVYRLDFPSTDRYAGLAFHSYDLRFVWDFFGKEVPTPAAATLARAMHGAWITFIQGKPPSATGLPAWPTYTLPQRPTMIFDNPSRIEQAPNALELALWNGLLTG